MVNENQSVDIMPTSFGLAAVGASTAADAAAAWLRHITEHHSPHAGQRLDELDWMSAVRRWFIVGARGITVLGQPVDDAPSGLLLLGRFTGFPPS